MSQTPIQLCAVSFHTWAVFPHAVQVYWQHSLEETAESRKGGLCSLSDWDSLNGPLVIAHPKKVKKLTEESSNSVAASKHVHCFVLQSHPWTVHECFRGLPWALPYCPSYQGWFQFFAWGGWRQSATVPDSQLLLRYYLYNKKITASTPL